MTFLLFSFFYVVKEQPKIFMNSCDKLRDIKAKKNSDVLSVINLFTFTVCKIKR